MKTRTVVYSAVIAAIYVTLTYLVAPISYGPLQFRVAELLKPLALFNPLFAFGLGLGNFISNLGSPFGFYDFGIMPFVATGAALLCWLLRRWSLVGLTVQAIIVAAGVAFFPLGMGARLPFIVTFPGVLLSELVIIVLGYLLIWRKYGNVLA